MQAKGTSATYSPLLSFAIGSCASNSTDNFSPEPTLIPLYMEEFILEEQYVLDPFLSILSTR